MLDRRACFRVVVKYTSLQDILLNHSSYSVARIYRPSNNYLRSIRTNVPISAFRPRLTLLTLLASSVAFRVGQAYIPAADTLRSLLLPCSRIFSAVSVQTLQSSHSNHLTCWHYLFWSSLRTSLSLLAAYALQSSFVLCEARIRVVQSFSNLPGAHHVSALASEPAAWGISTRPISNSIDCPSLAGPSFSHFPCRLGNLRNCTYGHKRLV